MVYYLRQNYIDASDVPLIWLLHKAGNELMLAKQHAMTDIECYYVPKIISAKITPYFESPVYKEVTSARSEDKNNPSPRRAFLKDAIYIIAEKMVGGNKETEEEFEEDTINVNSLGQRCDRPV